MSCRALYVQTGEMTCGAENDNVEQVAIAEGGGEVGERRVRGAVDEKGRRRGICLMPPVSDHLDCKQVKDAQATSPRAIMGLYLLRE